MQRLVLVFLTQRKMRMVFQIQYPNRVGGTRILIQRQNPVVSMVQDRWRRRWMDEVTRSTDQAWFRHLFSQVKKMCLNSSILGDRQGGAQHCVAGRGEGHQTKGSDSSYGQFWATQVLWTRPHCHSGQRYHASSISPFPPTVEFRPGAQKSFQHRLCRLW